MLLIKNQTNYIVKLIIKKGVFRMFTNNCGVILVFTIIME